MKSSIVLITLFAFAIGSPLPHDDLTNMCKCVEDTYTVCVLSVSGGCECKLNTLNECFEAKINSGLTCPPPQITQLSSFCQKELKDPEGTFKIATAGKSCNLERITLGHGPVCEGTIEDCPLETAPGELPICGPGLKCYPASPSSSETEGTCQPIAPIGPQSCQYGAGVIDDSCGEGMACGPSSGQGPCTTPSLGCTGVCQAIIQDPIGPESCEYGNNVEDTCGEGKTCKPRSGETCGINPELPCTGDCQAE